MKTPLGAGGGGGGGGITSSMGRSMSHTKRKRDVEYFHTKRLNKSPTGEFIGGSNTSVSLKNRVRTIKKIDSIARTWINSGNDLLGLELHQAGELLCIQSDKLILFSGVQSSNVTSVDMNNNHNDDFEFLSAIATVSTDEISSRKYLVSVDGEGRVMVRSLLANNTVSNRDDTIATTISLEGDNERYIYIDVFICFYFRGHAFLTHYF